MFDTLHQALANPANVGLIAAALAATVSGALLYTLREMPRKLGVALEFLFSVELIIYSEEEMYDVFGAWLAKENKAKRSRTLMMNEHYDYALGKWSWQITIGHGFHFVRHDGNWFLLHRSVKESEGLSALFGRGRQGEIRIRTFGRSQKPIRDLMAKVKAMHEGDGTLRVYYWTGGSYTLVDRKNKRDLSTMFMDETLKSYLLDDMQKFAASREDYRKRGTPYRRGYCFWGQPGTGKTTLIAALAGAIDRSLYVINLAQVGGDNGLQQAINGIGPDGVGVIEDIDTHKVTHVRKGLETNSDAVPLSSSARTRKLAKQKKDESQETETLTLSGVLNAIDGIASREGRILAVTTNRLDVLDPALLRPGRFAVKVEIPLISEYDARRMYAAYFPDDTDQTWFNQEIAPKLPMGASALEELYVGRENALAS